MDKKDFIIEKLKLQPHPEGGFFKETYRSKYEIFSEECNGNRNYSTCIYFMLTADNFSAFHRIKQDEIWHFYDGDPIELHIISESGNHSEYTMGTDLSNEQLPQLVVPANHWFAAKVKADGDFSLVGCTVAPGFNFADFEMGKRRELVELFPGHQKIIEQFTRD